MNRAIVLGGGMAGLLAAHVLAGSYREVLLVDRDTLLGVDEPRRGVPQGGHAHGLLARGQQIMEEFFPGMTGDLAAAGIPTGDLGVNLRWYFNGRRLRPVETGLVVISATRPEIESYVRRKVAALPNVTFQERTAILGLSHTDGRVTGVRVENGLLPADLVVDATGRGSRTPAWLEELGYGRPSEDRVKIGLSYTTCHYELDHNPVGDDMAILCVATADNPRGAFFSRLDGRFLLSLTGMLGDQAPTDPQGHLAFIKSLVVPDIYEAVRDARIIDERVAFRYPASQRRRYDQMARLPEGLLIVGDAVCSFNPVYGQGMTVAAMEAVALKDHLAAGPPRPLEFAKEISAVIDAPWDMAAGGDLSWPGVQGHRPRELRMANLYMDRLRAAAVDDGELTRAFMMAAGLMAPVSSLMAPEVAARVMKAA